MLGWTCNHSSSEGWNPQGHRRCSAPQLVPSRTGVRTELRAVLAIAGGERSDRALHPSHVADGFTIHPKEKGECTLGENYSGALPGFHLMLQPMLGFWLRSTGLPASTASMAARRSRPVTGLLLPGRLSSSCPRYTSRCWASNR